MPKTKPRHSTWGGPETVTATALDSGRRGRKHRKSKSAFDGMTAEQAAAVTAAALKAGEQAVAKRKPADDTMSDAELARRRDIEAGQRARAMPYRATAAVGAAGMAAWGAGEFADLAGGAAAHGVAGVASGIAMAGGAVAWRTVMRRAFEPGWGRRYWAAAACATGWVGAMGTVGPSMGMAAALVAPAAILASRWMAAHEVPHPADGQLALEAWDGPAGPPASVQAFVDRWDELISRGRSDLLPDSRLSGGHVFDNGMEFRLELAGGQTVDTVQSKRAKIASVLGIDAAQLLVERPPKGPDGFSPESIVRLRYLLRSPITEIVEHTAASYRNGKVALGPYADGDGMAEWTLHIPNGVRSGVVIGSSGSGKSGLSNGLVAGCRASGLVVTVYFDPKESSSPEIAATATVPVIGLDRAGEFTQAVEDLVEGRRREQAALNRSGYTPTVDRPTYLIVIDECDMLFRLDGMAARWGVILKTIRSLGIAVICLTQQAGQAMFGGDNPLRDSLAAGNIALLQCATGSGSPITKGLPDPMGLPKKPGYGYLQTDGARSDTEFRALRLRSLEDCEEEGRPLDSWNALTALEAYPDVPMCRIGQRALSPLLAAAGDATPQEVAQSRLDAWLAGQDTAVIPVPAATTAATNPWGPIPGPLLPPEPAPARPAVEVPPLEDVAAAAELVIRAQFGSTSMIQRKMRVGHDLATRLVLRLAEVGVLGVATEDLPRPVLVPVEGLDMALAAIRDGAPVPTVQQAPAEPQEAPQQVGEAKQAPATPDGLSPTEAAVWAVLPVTEPMSVKDIAEAAGLRPDSTSRALSRLRGRDVADSPRRGTWTRRAA